MKVYNYSGNTGEYLGWNEGDKDPLDTASILIPAFSTNLAPPPTNEGEIAVFCGDKWNVSIDLRGTAYWLPDGSKHEIINIGQSVPDTASLSPILPEPTSKEINAECLHRVRSYIVFKSRTYSVDRQSIERINGAVMLAIAALVSGKALDDAKWADGITDFNWIDQNNDLVPMPLGEMINFGKACGSRETAHVFAAKSLKEMSPIPQDYSEDYYWPLTE